MVSPKTFVDYELEESLGERPELDPFLDDTPIEAMCDLENPEECESCQ